MTQTLNTLTERRPALLAQVQATQTDGVVHIDIPNDAPIATNKDSCRSFELAPENKGKWRWPASGFAVILDLIDVNVLLTIHRDEKALTYGDHDTLPSGLGSSVREMLYPLETAWRKCAEELCIVTPDTIICPVPVPKADPFGFSLELTEITRGTANLFPELSGKPIKESSAWFECSLPGEQKVVINYAEKTRTTDGLIVFDPGCNGIDLLKAVIVPVNCLLKDLTVYDGELAGKNPLNRIVNAYELYSDHRPTGKIIASWKEGRRIEPRTFNEKRMTPVLKSIYKALSSIPGNSKNVRKIPYPFNPTQEEKEIIGQIESYIKGLGGSVTPDSSWEGKLRHLDVSFPGNLSQAQTFRKWLNDRNWTCFIHKQGGDGSLKMAVYTSRDELTDLQKLIEPYTLANIGDSNCGGAENRSFFYFQNEADRAKAKAILSDTFKHTYDYMSDNWYTSYQPSDPWLLENFPFGLHILWD